MKCPKCEKELQEGTVFCPYCGCSISAPEEKKGNTTAVPVEVPVEATMEPVQQAETVVTREEMETPVIQNITETEKTAEMQRVSEPAMPEMQPDNHEDVVFCGACGKKISSSASCCPYCGTVRNGQNEKQGIGGYDQVNSYTPSYSYPIQKPQKKKGVTGFVIAGVCLIVLLIAAVIGFNILRPAKQAFLYMKDNEHVYANQYKQGSDQRIDRESGVLWQYVSDDGKRLYYAVNTNAYDTDYYDLYCVNLKKLKNMPEKVARDVKNVTFLKNNEILYVNTDNNMYLLGKKNVNRLQKNINSYYVPEDEKNLFWIDANKDLYVQQLAAEAMPQKVSSNVQYISLSNDDASTMIVEKDDGTYEIKNMMTENKLPQMGDWGGRIGITDSGEVFSYYEKQSDANQISMYDFVEDDLFDQDQQITEPDEEQYSHTVLAKGFWGGVYEDTVIDDAYYEALDRYNEKVQRDNMRERLKQDLLYINQAELVYYSDATGEQSLGTFNQLSYTVPLYADMPYLVLSYMQTSTIEKVRFSDILNNDIYWAEDTIQNRVNNSAAKQWVVYSGAVSLGTNNVNGEYISDAWMDKEHGKMYISLADQNATGDYLCDIMVCDMNTGVAASYVEDVNSFYFCKGHTYYAINGMLYCDGGILASNVEDSFYLQQFPGSDTILLVENTYSSDQVKYNLSLIENNRAKTIERNVDSFEWIDEDSIIYMTDKASYTSNGILSVYTKDRIQRIARDVNGIVSKYNNNHNYYINGQIVSEGYY